MVYYDKEPLEGYCNPVPPLNWCPTFIDNRDTPTYLETTYIDYKKDLKSVNFIEFYCQLDAIEYLIVLHNIILIGLIPYIIQFYLHLVLFSKSDFVPNSSTLLFYNNAFLYYKQAHIFALLTTALVLIYYREDRNMAYAFFQEPENRLAVQMWREKKKKLFGKDKKNK